MKKPTMADIYSSDGVDIDLSDAFSNGAGEICRASFSNSPFVRVNDVSDHFRGIRGLTLDGLPAGWSLDMTTDGIGTKCEIISAASQHQWAADDLVAMCCGDITRNGGCPVVLNNDLSINSLSNKTYPTFMRMMARLGEVARANRLVLFRGETAVMGDVVGSQPSSFVWSATAVGIYLPSLMISGDRISEGQDIVALREYGFRSNGLSSVRRAFERHFGSDWKTLPEAQSWIDEAPKPSTIYDPLLTEINGWYHPKFEQMVSVRGIIHVTGGAIPSKLGRDVLFPRGLSADLEDLYSPPDVVRHCKEWRGMTSEECYTTWNCGQGVLLIIDPSDTEDLLSIARDRGYDVKPCGKVMKGDDPHIQLRSMFDGETIRFDGCKR